jgi:peptidyl-Lys metalloendopeptidase
VAHLRVLGTAREEARARLAEAISFVRQQPGHPHLRRWFGDTDPAQVLDVLERSAARLERMEALKLACNDRGQCRSAFAYTVVSVGLLGLCPGFFTAGTDGTDTRWGVLIHEATHLAGGTDDHAYGRRAALVLAKQDPARAAANADSYEYFVETLPR